MPAKNTQKVYVKDAFYHLYNRGVEKRTIFKDRQDYSVFLGYLKEYLEPKDEKGLYKQLSNPSIPWSQKAGVLKLLRLNNFQGKINLLSYCLMPNHFHFLVKQTEVKAIDQFLNSLLTRYSMYFNRKYRRVGHLFQDVYKAVLVETEGQLLHLSRYIHQNTLSFKDQEKGKRHQYDYTSLPEYLGNRKTDWVQTQPVLSHFPKTNPRHSYRSFVHKPTDLEIVRGLTIDETQ